MASDNIKRYIWETQIVPQLGYSFSDIHSTGYSLIALQMMNLEHHYPSVFWNTACLSVNANADEDMESNKSTNYGKIAAAISRMKKQGIKVSLPYVNKAKFGFTPDVEHNQIFFGLKGINGLGDDASRVIIQHRPYQSFEDFYVRLYETKLIQKSQLIHLIKAGAFNEFASSVEIMKQFLLKEVDVKEKLNGQNLPRIISLGLLDTPELKQYQDLYYFRKHVMKSVHKTVDKPKDKIYILDAYSQAFFDNNFTYDSVVGDHNGKLLVSDKLLKKEYDTKMLALSELYTDKEFVRKYNIAQFYELWNTFASGTVEKWEMESVSFYSDKHELDGVDYERYGITDFFSLSETPIVTQEFEWKGRQMKNFQLFTIVGTVLDKNKNTHTITVLTPDGVINAKTFSGAFSHYDKRISKVENGSKTVLENSWFARGNLLMLSGYRRDDQFVLKAPKGQHTINLITEVREDGSLGLQSERTRA